MDFSCDEFGPCPICDEDDRPDRLTVVSEAGAWRIVRHSPDGDLKGKTQPYPTEAEAVRLARKAVRDDDGVYVPR